MSRAFDRPHRGHVSRSDELLSVALRRGCRGRNRALLPFCTVIDTSTFRGRVARRGRSCFRCVPVYAPKTGRRYDQRRLAQFRCERSVYTRRRPVPALFARLVAHRRAGADDCRRCPAQKGAGSHGLAPHRAVGERATGALGVPTLLADALRPIRARRVGTSSRGRRRLRYRREYSWQEH